MEQSARIPRKEQEKEARKQDILDTAAKLFSKKGFHETTMDEIAESVGLAKGTIYLYYENKDNLFFSILINSTQAIYSRLQSVIQEEQEFNACLRRFVETFLTFFHENEDFMRIIQSEKGRLSMEKHYEFHSHAQQLLTNLLELNRQLIKTGQKQKILTNGNIIEQSKALMGMVYMFSIHHMFSEVEPSIPKDTEQIVSLFLHGASAKQ